MYKHIILLVLVTLFYSCAKENKLDIDVSDIKANATIMRFDQDFYTTPITKLPELKEKYPYFFPAQTPDSIWIQKMQDKDEQELFAETQKIYTDFTDNKEALNLLFKHIAYYFPQFQAPKVITLLTNVDYTSNVIYADSLMLISLDLYLGKESDIYDDVPKYIKQNFTKEHLIVDVANAISSVQIPKSNDRTFVSRMIQKGKKMYVLDAYLPTKNTAEKIGYTQEQIEWCEFNDVAVWKYFVQNKLLFSTDQKLSQRFIDRAPFSKFNQANDNETPGRIGEWFGWQIVKAYMQNNKASLPDLLKTSNEEVFKKSKYKPTK